MNQALTPWVTSCALALALALGACRSAPTRFYSLEETAPATRLDAHTALSLRVDSLSVPAGWDRVEILRPAGKSLEISEFDHWSAPLREAARQALSADLSDRLPSGSVIYPRLPKPYGASGIDVDILEFTVSESHASMQASWVIIPGAPSPAAAPAAGPPAAGSPAAAKRDEALLQCLMSSAQPAEVVRAWSDLIGQLANHIAADIVKSQTPD